LASLPKVPVGHPLRQEWIIRQKTADKLVAYLHKARAVSLIEVGCGNGWLMNYLREQLSLDCAGIDMNVTELEQAERIFGHRDGFTLVYGDILSSAFQSSLVDVIVVASSIQYFPDLALLINKLLAFLRPHGEIHILDSPLYTTQEAMMAKGRSTEYFRQSGHEAMNRYYFHHTWESLQEFSYQVLYDPGSWQHRFNRVFRPDSPFPWIKISQSYF
jgi:ubiquinone/menaquinone biosynthesis C-methylase UbiE